MSEAKLQAEIMLAVGRLPDVRIFRNAVGEGWMGRTVEHRGDLITLRNPWRVKFGLTPGSADLIGLRSITITPDMVGQTIAQFTSLEVKTASGSKRPGQPEWDEMVRRRGGLSGFVRSVDQAVALVSA